MDRYKMMNYYRLFSTRDFEEANFYQGNDLGAVWTEAETRFRVWAPTAHRVVLHLYETGDHEDLKESIPMVEDIGGTWRTVVGGDLNGIYYTFSVTVEDETKEAVDPYAKAAGVNGNRGMVVNLSATDPEGFREEVIPEFINSTDAVIYEVHIRDFSMDQSSGMKLKGKYLAFTEMRTKNSYFASTGVEHLKELGITHVHLLPIFDYATVDETKLLEEQFNWGYDPKNYNVPDGSYSTDPYHGEIRIKEFKRMVQALHQSGIRVIMDVVYNHTMESDESNFNRIVPGYYYRMTSDGYFSNASGCGNETASERAMVRKFIIDSVVYWATEYHIDGFRFDLMGIHDIGTMNELRHELDEIEPGILIYGEGWTGGSSPLPDWERALKSNMERLDHKIAVFSDNLRDGIKGSVFSARERGFVNGQQGMEETIKYGVVASTLHNQVDYRRVHYTNAPCAVEPTQIINYTSSHDNLTLWDKLMVSNPEDSLEDRIKMNLLSAAIVMTCQGIPFFQAGEEFLRSKPVNEAETIFEENSYRSPDFVNSLKWDRKTDYKDVFAYYQGLIAFRKAHSALRMTRTSDLQANLSFIYGLQSNVVAFIVHSSHKEASVKDGGISDEVMEFICVIYNANRERVTLRITEGEWEVYAKGKQAGTDILGIITGGEVTVEPISAMIMIRNEGIVELAHLS